MLDFFSHPCKCQKYSTPAWRGKKLLKRCGWSRTNLKCVSQQIKWLITNESTARHRSQVGVYHILSTVVQAVTQWSRFSSTVTWPRGADTHMRAHVHTQESFFRFRLQTGHKSLRYSSIQSQHVLYWIFLDVVLLILYILYTINNVYTCVQYILHESGNMFYFINSVFFCSNCFEYLRCGRRRSEGPETWTPEKDHKQDKKTTQDKRNWTNRKNACFYDEKVNEEGKELLPKSVFLERDQRRNLFISSLIRNRNPQRTSSESVVYSFSSHFFCPKANTQQTPPEKQ